MKRLLITLFAVTILSGCAALAPKFDNVEYNHFVQLLSNVQRSKTLCSEPQIMGLTTHGLMERARTLSLYATYRPAHKEIKEITSLVFANLREMNFAYRKGARNPSKAYCIGKLTIVERSLQRALPVIGGLRE